MGRLEDLRHRAGFGTSYAAEVAGGFARGQIFQWEQGRRALRGDSAARLAKLYGCTVGQLLGTEPMPEAT